MKHLILTLILFINADAQTTKISCRALKSWVCPRTFAGPEICTALKKNCDSGKALSIAINVCRRQKNRCDRIPCNPGPICKRMSEMCRSIRMVPPKCAVRPVEPCQTRCSSNVRPSIPREYRITIRNASGDGLKPNFTAKISCRGGPVENWDNNNCRRDANKVDMECTSNKGQLLVGFDCTGVSRNGIGFRVLNERTYVADIRSVWKFSTSPILRCSANKCYTVECLLPGFQTGEALQNERL